MIDFNDIKIEHKDLIQRYFKNANILQSQYNFTNTFMWAKGLKSEFAIVDDFLVVSGGSRWKRPFCIFPTGSGDLKKPIEKILQHFNGNVDFKILTNDMVQQLTPLLPKETHGFVDCPNAYDYVYETQGLVSLSGKKLHAKRNHINKFSSLYNYEYREITPDLIPHCIELERKWGEEKEFEGYVSRTSENDAILEVLDNFEKLDCKGGAIFVNGKMVAFTFGEMLTNDTVLIHIEKADIEYQGVYPVINNEFIRREWSNTKFVNREEDMGLEGLKKSKMSYNPAFLVGVQNANYIGE